MKSSAYEMPENVKQYLAEYSKGEEFGYIDGKTKHEFATNFADDSYGFMTGYFHGYLLGKEKKFGWKHSQEVQSQISGFFRNKKIKLPKTNDNF